MKQQRSLVWIALALIVAAAVSRVILYPVSFSPMIAIALFGGAAIRNRALSFIIPLAAVFLSDVLFDAFNITTGFYGWAQVVNYILLGLVALLAHRMQRVSFANVALLTLLSCFGFYLFSNTAYFFLSNPEFHTYPQTTDGYVDTLVAGLPFLRASLISTACFSALFFGLFAFAQRNVAAEFAAE